MESKPLSDEYDPVLMESNADGWKLKLTPKPGTESDYSRLEVFINKNSHYLREADYYDRGGQKIKHMVNKSIELYDGYWTAKEIEMTDLVKSHSTVFKTMDLSFDNNLTADDFTVREMMK
jgi:hypothetical protein